MIKQVLALQGFIKSNSLREKIGNFFKVSWYMYCELLPPIYNLLAGGETNIAKGEPPHV